MCKQEDINVYRNIYIYLKVLVGGEREGWVPCLGAKGESERNP